MGEAEVWIDGVKLTDAQVNALRVALSSFLMRLNDEDGYEEDAQGIYAGHVQHGRAVEKMLVDGANRPDRIKARRQGK